MWTRLLRGARVSCVTRRCLALTVCVTIIAGLASPARAVTDEEVGQAIERIKKYLYSIQEKDGSWEAAKDSHTGGVTALVVLALLESGESPQRPELTRALQYLVDLKLGAAPPGSAQAEALKAKAVAAASPKPEAPKPANAAKGQSSGKDVRAGDDERVEYWTQSTYAVGVRSHVWAALPDDFLRLLEQDAVFLLERSHNGRGGFHYTPLNNSSAGYDNSCTQYGVLGVWEAAKRGAKVNPDFWVKVAEHFITSQNKDGGWQYSKPKPEAEGASSGSMTAAGLTSLFIVQQQLFGANSQRVPPKLAESLEKGLNWMDRHFAASGDMYYMYGVERVALASGYKHFNGQDWYQSGASVICRSNGAVGSIYGTAFALLFLSRGRVPVWASKLAIEGYAWNTTPNDLEFFTRYLSDVRQTELNWQVVRLNTHPEDWISSPVLMISSDKPLPGTDELKAKLKRYNELGGTILFIPQKKSKEFINSARSLLRDMYPDRELRKLPAEHAIYTALFRVEHPGAEEIQAVSNGARELAILPSKDWSAEFLAMGYPTSASAVRPSDTLKAAMNLWTVATDRGTLNNRLVRVYEAPSGAASARKLVVGRATYEGYCLPEPGSWDAMRSHLAKHYDLDVSTKDVALDTIGKSDLKLIHLAGVEGFKFTEAQLAAIKAYTSGGGTLLVETVGGKGTFAQQAQAQIQQSLQLFARPMHGSDDPILTGDGLARGEMMRRVVYRRDLVLTGLTPAPRLQAVFNEQGRPVLIFTGEDLSMGMLGIQQTGIFGYTRDSSRKLIGNLAQSVLTPRKPATVTAASPGVAPGAGAATPGTPEQAAQPAGPAKASSPAG